MTTFFAGSPVNAGDLEAIADPSICHLVQQPGATQSGWTAGAATAVTFGSGSTVIDSDSIHSESSNTSRLVIGKRLGWWQISGVYVPTSNAGASITQVRALIYKNGSAFYGAFGGGAYSQVFIGVETPTVLVQATSSTDYVELMGVMVGSGSPLGTTTSSPYVASSIAAVWVRA